MTFRYDTPLPVNVPQGTWWTRDLRLFMNKDHWQWTGAQYRRLRESPDYAFANHRPLPGITWSRPKMPYGFSRFHSAKRWRLLHRPVMVRCCWLGKDKTKPLVGAEWACHNFSNLVGFTETTNVPGTDLCIGCFALNEPIPESI